MVNELYSLTIVALVAVSLVVIFAALRQRARVRASNSDRDVILPQGLPIAVVASTARRARRWARQQGLRHDQYHAVDSVDDLPAKPCLYVPVDGYDQRPDWPALYAELSARGYRRWWPPMQEAETDHPV